MPDMHTYYKTVYVDRFTACKRKLMIAIPLWRFFKTTLIIMKLLLFLL